MNEWIEWEGGENPVPGRVVEVEFRDGREATSISDRLDWLSYHEYEGQIVKYRLVNSKKTGKKHDAGKQRYDLIPVHAESSIVDVLTFGAKKYGPNNWQEVENSEERYLAAAQRHIAAYRKGESNDNESGLPHLAHAATCLLFMLDKELTK